LAEASVVPDRCHCAVAQSTAMASADAAAREHTKFLPLQQCDDAVDRQHTEVERAPLPPPHVASCVAQTPSSRPFALRFFASLGVLGLLGLGLLLGVGPPRSGHDAGTAGGLLADGGTKNILGLRAKHQHGQCHTAEKGEACWENIEWAMTEGITHHPEKFANLDKSSGHLEFQDAVHRHWPHKCPAPCWPAPSNITCKAPLVLFDDRCHTAGPEESCWKEVQWSMQAGIQQHPEWYPELTASSIRADFQDHIYRQMPWRCPKPCGSVAEGGTCICPPPLVPDGMDDQNRPRCKAPDEIQATTFYMYQAQGDVLHPFENVNAGDIAGIMWYLHNEVVGTTPRKSNVTRILRYKVTVRNPAKLFQEFQQQFGPYVSFENAKCTVMGCSEIWTQHGFVVGCRNLDRRVANYVRDVSSIMELSRHRSGSSKQVTGYVRKLSWSLPIPFLSRGPSDPAEGQDGSNSKVEVDAVSLHPDEEQDTVDHASSSSKPMRTTMTSTTSAITTSSTTLTTTRLDGYHGGVQYSLPGPCPSMEFGAKTAKCTTDAPGGKCKGLTWDGTCTYQVEPAGEVSLDELSGIHNYAAFIKAGGVEYDSTRDSGKHSSFWNGRLDRDRCTRRMQQVLKLFREKYPQFPSNFPAPPCS